MAAPQLRLVPRPLETPFVPQRLPIGRKLVETGAISPEQLVKALHLQRTHKAQLGEILVAEGWARSEQVQTALARQFGLPRAELSAPPPDRTLCAKKPALYWLQHGALPWKREGGAVLIATASPDRFDQLRQELADVMGPVRPVLADKAEIARATAQAMRPELARTASARVAPELSCRDRVLGLRLVPPLLFTGLLAGFALAPGLSFALLCLLAVALLWLFLTLKLLAAAVTLAMPRRDPTRLRPDTRRAQRPKVSVMVPLYREREIAGALIRRLARLTYPKSLLDLVLVLEEGDHVTREAIRGARLPSWIRVVEVPAHGRMTTKPRAMNYALDFCRGEIIGVWDAEDAPAPDQIERVVAHFATAPPDVACLQGVLDFYNPRTNWLARCFTAEYAALFRMILPGLARMRLVVPLGGTTVFVRRDRLEELGGWDAHNVTEDADLGVRLCRAGYRTEVIDTVTCEEANCRPLPWIKQRSRWLKGYLITYLVHMRNPLRLLRELGGRGFLSFQAFFLGTLSQFLLAPVLWSFWLVMLGLPHPAEALLPAPAIAALAVFFVAAELATMAIALIAVRRAGKAYLIPFIPSLIFYFPLGALAAYKALLELALAPFYWDKTRHGQAAAETDI